MKALPVKARAFLVAIYGLAILAIGGVSTLPLPQRIDQKWEFTLFLILSVLAGKKKIHLMRHKGHEDVGSMSLGFAITYASMLRFGPLGGTVVGAISSFAGCIHPKRQPPHQLCFNVSLTVIESAVAGVVFVALNHWSLKLHSVDSFPAVIGSCLVYFAVNTVGVATIISLCTGQPIVTLWKNTFLWTMPSYFTSACVSALCLIFFENYVTTLLLFVSPAAYMTYQFYSVHTARDEEKQQHIEELEINQKQLSDLYLATIKSLALAIDAKDQYTHQHILRVQRYAVATAKRLGVSGTDLEGITTGALLHDIGKLGVPEYVLIKPGRLTEEEFAKIKKHPEIGAAILDPVAFPWPVLPVVKHHHEKWDGTGYPDGLKGTDIPYLARILAVADVYDALTSTRSYRGAWSHQKAIGVIKADSGTHFDPEVVVAFLEIIDGVLAEMAQEGEGPLATKAPVAAAPQNKAEQAARDIQRASSELWALYEVAQTLSSSLGLQETLDILVRKLEAILPGTAVLFLLAEEGSKDLTTKVAVGLNHLFFQNSKTLSQSSTSRQVLAQNRTYIGKYDSDDLMLSACSVDAWKNVNTALIVPIVHQGTSLGTINIYHALENAFSDHNVQLMEMIAERVALALYNGILFDRTRNHALSDSLTGLFNMRGLTDAIERRYHSLEQNVTAFDDNPPLKEMEATSHCRPFALLCLDLDSFKPINDNFGHLKGDEVLRTLAQIFREAVRADDIIARYGGDEFLIVLDGAEEQYAEQMVDRIKQAVENYNPGLVHPRLGTLRLGVSAGYACYPQHGTDFAALVSVADSRMYLDKTERKLGTLTGRYAQSHTVDTPSIAA